MTDTEITIALAGLEGWKLVDLPDHPNGPKLLWMTPDGVQTQCGTTDVLPRYLHDANAVLPLLEKHDWNCFHGKIGYEVEVEAEVASSVKPFGIAPTFCRAACIAVLKAHGLWREAQAEEGIG